MRTIGCGSVRTAHPTESMGCMAFIGRSYAGGNRNREKLRRFWMARRSISAAESSQPRCFRNSRKARVLTLRALSGSRNPARAILWSSNRNTPVRGEIHLEQPEGQRGRADELASSCRRYPPHDRHTAEGAMKPLFRPTSLRRHGPEHATGRRDRRAVSAVGLTPGSPTPSVPLSGFVPRPIPPCFNQTHRLPPADSTAAPASRCVAGPERRRRSRGRLPVHRGRLAPGWPGHGSNPG